MELKLCANYATINCFKKHVYVALEPETAQSCEIKVVKTVVYQNR